MSLHFHDTMAREKRAFAPADSKRVTMYVCGPTVYNYTHIGNARSAIAFDLLFRVLRLEYGAEHVVYARNFTDIDDKIIKASRETGKPIDEITSHFAQVYLDELAELNALAPSLTPRATDHIPEMIALVERLIEKGAAYEGDGHVLFNVDAFEDYGHLSGANRDEMIAGARVEVAPYKKNPADFVLWKPSSEDEPGWDSPWGRGRPGWHLECSVMIKKGWAKPSTFIAVVRICVSLIMKMKSRNRAVQMTARRSHVIGCTMDSSAWGRIRCRNLSAMWSLPMNYSRTGMARLSAGRCCPPTTASRSNGRTNCCASRSASSTGSIDCLRKSQMAPTTLRRLKASSWR